MGYCQLIIELYEADRLNQKGISHYNRGELLPALDCFRQALEIREREAPNSLTVATSYNNIGLVLYDQGDLEAALVNFQRCRGIPLHPDLSLQASHPVLATCNCALGRIS